jgi:hypothetical protein
MGIGTIISLVFTLLTKMPELIPAFKAIVEFFKWAIDLFKSNDLKLKVPAESGPEVKARVQEMKKASFDNAVTVKLESMFGIKATPLQVEKIRDTIDKVANPKRKFEGGRKP